MRKRVWAMVLAVAMVLSLMVVPVSADTTTGTEGYLSYSITDGEVTITSCDTSASGELEIPDTIEGYPVTTIGSDAFNECNGLTEVTIPDSVTSIKSYAFANCTSMTDVTIGSGVTSIGSYAFSSCSSLTDITIPGSVTSISRFAFDGCTSLVSIGNYAFASCDGLTGITIPDSVTSIGSYAFYECTGLTSVPSSDGVTSIGNYAFADCYGLTNITIPDSWTSVGTGVFNHCTNLTKVAIPDSVTSIGDYTFGDCISLTSITIPDSVTSIGGYAFVNCTNLTDVIIGNGVTSIGSYAFDGCTSLTSIAVSDDNASYMSEDGVLFNKTQTSLIRCPEGKTGSYTIPDSVTYIGEYAFSNCTGLINIAVNSGEITIAKYAFYWCSGLTSIIFKGDAPTFIVNGFDGPLGSFAFSGVTATAYYPADNDAWTSSVMQDYGGTITWVAYDPDTPASCITGHTEGDAVIENEVATTCTEAGSYDIVIYCTVCGAELSRETVIVPATGSTDPEPTEPTDPEPTEPTEPEPEPTEENPFTDVVNTENTSWYYNAVLWAVKNEITEGITSSTFVPEGKCTRAQIVTFLWRAAGSPEPTSTENPFTDVVDSEDNWYYKAVLWAVENGITEGVTETSFSPDSTCTRAQAVTFIWRVEGSPEPTSTENPFTDVVDTEDNWYYNAVLWAVENGITEGVSETSFSPDSTCTRAQIVTFLYRALVK